MQIPSKLSDPFIKSMTEKSEQARSIFQEKIANVTKSIPVKLMLGDSTIVEQNTFDPKNVETFYQNVLKKIPDWKTQGISVSNDKDLRRIFIKFEISEGNYLTTK
jgi:ssDNA-specific exonuclease RecJ